MVFLTSKFSQSTVVSTFSNSYVPSDKAAKVDLPPSLNVLHQPSNEELTDTELLQMFVIK